MQRIFLTLLFTLPLLLMAQNDTIMGDLDADGVLEMVVIYPVETPEGAEEDTLAKAIVYRWEGKQFIPWLEATGPLLYAWDEVGYARLYIEIDRGTLVLHHYHSGWTSTSTIYRFRWQNDRFELIGATVNYTQRCENVQELDYNLSTGRFIYEEYTMICDEEQLDPLEDFTRKGSSLATSPYLLTEFEPGDGQVAVKGRGFVSF